MNANGNNGEGSASNGSDRLMCVNDYNLEAGRLRASILWLITRIYNGENQLPDGLREPFKQNSQGVIELSTPVIACLTNGSFYCQAASKIFKDNSILMNNIGSVFHVLSQSEIDVRDQAGACITEANLVSQSPFNTNAHLLLIDALMTAHLRSIVSIEKVVHAISNYTLIEKREEPLDCVDALLFWINKICLIVREDVERNGIQLTGGDTTEATIPEMEDLYEDLCDGACICTLVSFYRPNELSLQEICFKDSMSVNDCKFNLEILKKFCSTCLQWNPIHFEIDDILYLHESLQPNVNAFLADLFNFFEGQADVEPEPLPSQPIRRRFVPIQPIPDLREQSKLGEGRMAGKLVNVRLGLEKRDRTLSLASNESMMTGTTLKSRDSLSFASSRQPRLDPNVPITHFGTVSTDFPKDVHSSMSEQTMESQQQRKSLAEIRLQMEEMRRQLARRQQMESAKQKQARNEASKDAFFRVISRNNGLVQSAAPPVSNETNADTVEKNSQLPNQFCSQLSMRTQTPTNPHHYDQPQQQSTMVRSTLQLNQQQLPAPQQIGLNFPQHQQTSTPQNQMQAQQHYATPHHSNISPIGPQPPGSFMFSPNDASFQQALTCNQQTFHPQQTIGGSTIFTSPQQYFPQQQPNFTPIPNGAPPSFHHQFFMDRQQSLNQQPYNNSNVYPTVAPNANYGGQLIGTSQPQATYFGSTSTAAPSGGPGIQLQPSFSQPSHLHLLHQQQPQPTFQQPLMFNTPNNGQHQSPAYQQQTIQPIPLGSTATMYQSTETMVMPPHQSQIHNLTGQQPPTIDEEHRPSPFRLHQSNAPASRLDPQLELNKDLTNWGMTYRAGDRPQRKTWAQKQAENSQLNQPSSQNNNNSSSTSDPLETIAAVATPISVIPGITPNSTPEKDQQPWVGMAQMAKSIHDAFGLDSDVSMSGRAVGMVLEDATDSNSEMTPEMQAKRRALLANQIRRKERIVAKSEEKEMESLGRRHSEMVKSEQAEQRKAEREQRRQKLLEDYKRKKMEQELGEPNSARMCTSSTISLNRGQSQPPFGRPKSQSNLNLHSARRPGRTQSNMMNDENTTPRVCIPSIAEPSLKLFAKTNPKSNRGLIMNALQYSVFPGHVSSENRQKAQTAMATSDSKHFLVLFRDHRLQYRGIYTWDQYSDTCHKIEGMGPKVCTESMMAQMFKYDSGAKSFGQIPTKHLSVTIDGFVIGDQYWQKPKIPHSGR